MSAFQRYSPWFVTLMSAIALILLFSVNANSDRAAECSAAWANERDSSQAPRLKAAADEREKLRTLVWDVTNPDTALTEAQVRTLGKAYEDAGVAYDEAIANNEYRTYDEICEDLK